MTCVLNVACMCLLLFSCVECLVNIALIAMCLHYMLTTVYLCCALWSHSKHASCPITGQNIRALFLCELAVAWVTCWWSRGNCTSSVYVCQHVPKDLGKTCSVCVKGHNLACNPYCSQPLAHLCVRLNSNSSNCRPCISVYIDEKYSDTCHEMCSNTCPGLSHVHLVM